MKFYTSVVQLGNQICVRGVENGRRFQSKPQFKPRLFIPQTKLAKNTYHNIFGEGLEMIEFGDVADAREFVKTYEDVGNMKIHGNTNWQYQYITENYAGHIDFDMRQVDIQH